MMKGSKSRWLVLLEVGNLPPTIEKREILPYISYPFQLLIVRLSKPAEIHLLHVNESVLQMMDSRYFRCYKSSEPLLQ